ncbi:MAG TPA: glycoside hydrolase family 66 protein [Herpetosiphonaceae bacterium]
MTASLRAAMRSSYDFLVGYQNLLRDQVVSAADAVTMTEVPTSTDGPAGAVWTLVESRPGAAVVHL